MGKGKNRHHRQASSPTPAIPADPLAQDSSGSSERKSVYQWCRQEKQGIAWILACVVMGSLVGFGLGTGLLTGDFWMTYYPDGPPNNWRVALGVNLRKTHFYQRIFEYGFFGASADGGPDLGSITAGTPSSPYPSVLKHLIGSSSIPSSYSISNKANQDNFRSHAVVPTDPKTLRSDPSHPAVYAVLREAIVREAGGYVHPDLGILSPAPCGAARGIGMVRNNYHRCQIFCIPGRADEKLQAQQNASNTTENTKIPQNIHQRDATKEGSPYKQEEVLIKVPLTFQMTRQVALDMLLPRVSAEVQRKASLHELDDAALLVLLLAHERGVGKYSRWLPYIASLPLEPSCGYSANLRPYLLDSIQALQDELGLDVNGWPGELLKATEYAERIVHGLAKDYGSFLQHPKGMSAVENIQWALCQVASRGTAGSQKHGALRMIPLMDMINHDKNAGGFVELTGKERLQNGDFFEALEADSGAFVVRSLRYGRRKALRPGQELLVNYNVPHYSALDWFVSLGFVPPERFAKWEKFEAALPRVRRDGPFGSTAEFSTEGRGARASSGQPYHSSGATTAASNTEL